MDKKVFSLFNTGRWSDSEVRPTCCDVVPVLYQGVLTPDVVEYFQTTKPLLKSQAALNYGVDFHKPEGYMIYFTKAKTYFKIPLDK